MNPEIKTQWVDALRSEQYVQTTGLLRHDDGYCCLGVLCDLAAKAGVVSETPDLDQDGVFRYGGSVGTLPDVVKEWAGLDSDDPYVNWTNDEGAANEPSLATLNDDYGLDFHQIADLIDAQL